MEHLVRLVCVVRSTLQAQAGSASLRMNVTTAGNWGVQLGNWPAFASSPGDKTVSFWGRQGTGVPNAVTLTARWRDEAGTDLGTSTASLTLTESWQKATADVTAPPARPGCSWSWLARARR